MNQKNKFEKDREYEIKDYKTMKEYLDFILKSCKDKELKDVFSFCGLSWSENYEYTKKRYDIDAELYFVFEDNTIIKMNYMWYSNNYIKLTSMDKLMDSEINCYNDNHIMDLNIGGTKIIDYELEYFNEGFEINLSTREEKSTGGDYFKNIIFYLDNKTKIYITPEEPISDGYCDVWIEEDNKKGIYRY